MSDPRHPILRQVGPTSKLGAQAGTMMADTPTDVRAVTVTSAVIGVPELVMNALARR